MTAAPGDARPSAFGVRDSERRVKMLRDPNYLSGMPIRPAGIRRAVPEYAGQFSGMSKFFALIDVPSFAWAASRL